MKARLAILILNYNGLRYLDELFRSLGFLEGSDRGDVWLVDNASFDASVEWTAKHHPWVKRQRNAVNLGFGEGYNRAIEAIRAAGHAYTHYVFLNNDVIVSREWFEGLLAAVEGAPNDVGEWGARALFRDPFAHESPIWLEGHQRKIGLAWAKQGRHSHLHWITGPHPDSVQLDLRTTLPTPSEDLYAITLWNPEKRTRVIRAAKGFEIRSFHGAPMTSADNLREGHQRPPTSLATRYAIVRSGAPEKTSRGPLRLGPPIRSLCLRPCDTVRFDRLGDPTKETVVLCQNSGSGMNDRFEGFDLHAYESADCPQDHTAVAAICGVCKVVRADLFHRIGGFSPHYFMYYEDTDFSLRVRAEGYRLVLLPHVRFLHEHSGTSQEHSPFFSRQVAWSLLAFHHLHAPPPRKLRTYLRYLLLSEMEKRDASRSDFSKFHLLARRRFESTFGPLSLAPFQARRALEADTTSQESPHDHRP